MKKINVSINPYLEFINSILLTSKYNEITKPYVGYGLMTEEMNEYASSIKSFFDFYLDHQIYQLIESMIPNGFTFSRPVELALCLGNSTDFTYQFKPSDFCIELCGGEINIHKLLSRLKLFSDECNYFEFFETAKFFYHPIIEKVNKDTQKYDYISMLESEYGKEQNSYNYVLSSLMRGNYGFSFINKETEKADMYSVFTIDAVSLSTAILFHEYSHPFINPLTEKFSSIVDKYQNAYEWLKPYKLPNYQSGYGDWKECINEHFVRAMSIHLCKKCQLVDLANEFINRDLKCGYKFIPLILEKYDYYDQNRKLYHNFESYYPELLQVFSEHI